MALDFIKNIFKKNEEDLPPLNEPFGQGMPNPPYDFPQNQFQNFQFQGNNFQQPGQLNPQAYLPNLPPQPQNDLNTMVQALNSKLDLIANKLDNIITLLNTLLQYYQYMFRR
ncbi:MAG: hypothetical protein ACP5GJ_02205 [Nanopusillaceae archaeon]|jgi:hypothetical protein